MSQPETIAHYRITSKLGEGGMGAVYRATDTKLGREVAIKVIPESFAKNPDRLARFTREAQVLASLNHPNIAAIYGVEERAIVMELVEGLTLDQRIRALPMSLENALPIARQVAEALEAAHEKAIVHRDLKPSNVKITPEGVVKVLDFGLAMAPEQTTTSDDPGASPTLTMHRDMLIGTAAYMSPEQAHGKTADRRTDIWSFGALLYEMLTGRQAFAGESISDTLALVLKFEPNWNVLPRGTPPEIRSLLRRCLTKDRKQRLQAIGDARIALEECMAGTAFDEPAAPAPVRRPALLWGLAATAAIAILALALVVYRDASQNPHPLRLSVLPPENASFEPNSPPAISPDGRHVAFAAHVAGRTQLWVRDLDSLAARPLPGGENADNPFWSPDGRFVAFFAGGKLKKIEVTGGPAQVVCDAPLGKGGTWNADNVIVFSPGTLDGLYRVPAAGGSATQLTTPDQSLGEDSHRWPWFLPDGRHFLYTARNSVQEKTTIYVGDLESPNPQPKDRRRLLTTNSNAVYAAPGMVLYMRERALMAQPFNAGRVQFTGDPIAVEQADYLPFFALGAFSVSRNGVLACYSGNSAKSSQLTWFDRSGKSLGPVGDPGESFKPAISPDGSRLVVDRLDAQGGTYDIWLHDLVRGTGSRITYDPRQDLFPVWSPDGNRVVFASNRDGQFDLYRMPVNSPGSEQLLLKSPFMKFPCDWSRDGRYLIYRQDDPKTKEDLWVLPDPGGALGSQKPFAYLQSEFNEQWAKLSPDLRWLAYTSDETGRNEVYVQTFPTPGLKSQVSTEGGSRPVWRADGKELFYIASDRKLVAVDVKTGSEFAAGVPKPLFETHVGGDRFFDISPDGRRFLLVNLPDQTAGTPMTVVIDWIAGAKK